MGGGQLTHGGMRKRLIPRCAPGVQQTDIDAQLGALRSRPGKRGRAPRCSAARLVVRFEGETALTRIRPHLVQFLPEEVPDEY